MLTKELKLQFYILCILIENNEFKKIYKLLFCLDLYLNKDTFQYQKLGTHIGNVCMQKWQYNSMMI